MTSDTGAMLYQLSYEATHWEQGPFIEFISSRAVKIMINIYEIMNISNIVQYNNVWTVSFK